MSESLREQVGATLRWVRNARKVGVRPLARASGVSTRTIQQLERGRVDCTLATVSRLADALEVPLNLLFTPVEELERAARIPEELARLADDYAETRSELEELQRRVSQLESEALPLMQVAAHP